jgi:hypothetical protein
MLDELSEGARIFCERHEALHWLHGFHHEQLA